MCVHVKHMAMALLWSKAPHNKARCRQHPCSRGGTGTLCKEQGWGLPAALQCPESAHVQKRSLAANKTRREYHDEPTLVTVNEKVPCE